MTGQLARLLENQATNADHHGDADRIAWWQSREQHTPERH